MVACVGSGRAAVAELFGHTAPPVADVEIDALYETPEVPTTIAPPVTGAPAFLDSGVSLITRPDPSTRPVLTRHAQAPSLGDVAASVELGLTLPADAGAVAEERGAPGGDLAAAAWAPQASADDGRPEWLVGRFGERVETIHLIVDGKRRFERGALVYTSTARPDPLLAIGVIESDAAAGEPGGIALVSSAALQTTDRFIVETLDGPSPARPKPVG
jgi:sarcosine oxidase subunit alpha